ALPHEISDRADRIEVFALEEAQAVRIGNAFAGDNFVVDVAQFAAFEKKAHRNLNPPWNTTSVTVTTRKTVLIKALSRKNAVLIQLRLRRRASQCSNNRLPRMITRPTKYATRKRQSSPKSNNRPHMNMCDRNAAWSAFFGPQATTSEWRPCRRSKS